MNRLFIIALSFGLLISASAETPTEALAAYKKAEKAKDFEATWKHIAAFEGMSEELIKLAKENFKSTLEIIDEMGSDFKILEEKVSNDCAVIVIIEFEKKGDRGTLDLDPIYLIKQKGTWKIMPDFTDWDIAKEYAKNQVADFQKLDAWYEKREAEIRKERGE